jgi:hypothetical protein
MNKRTCVWLLLATVGVALPSWAEPPGRPAEALAGWQWYQELRLPEPVQAGRCQFRLTAKVLDGARGDLQDLRLFDAGGREVPYALRIRLPRDQSQAFEIREFNRVKHPDRSVEVSLDLGMDPGEHNRIEVSTGGVNYRRFLRLEGSDDGRTWKPMLDKHVLTYFSSGGSTFDRRQVAYGASRYRYLRVRVFPDPALENDAPTGPRMRVLRTIRSTGLELPWPAELSQRSPIRDQGDYASVWFISLPGREQVPWSRLVLDADDPEFTRSYRIENDDERETHHQVLAQGEWQRSPGRRDPLTVVFSSEVVARRLRLVIIDQRNPSFGVRLISATAAAREVTFDRPGDASGPWRLYFGNPSATNPGYDYARSLPEHFEAEPPVADAGQVVANPSYAPAKPPLTERWPAMTYVVFGIVGVILLAILIWLARRAIGTHDAGQRAAEPPASDDG